MGDEPQLGGDKPWSKNRDKCRMGGLTKFSPDGGPPEKKNLPHLHIYSAWLITQRANIQSSVWATAHDKTWYVGSGGQKYYQRGLSSGCTPLNTVPILFCVKAYSKNRHFRVFIMIKIGQTHVFQKDYVHIHQIGSHFVGGVITGSIFRRLDKNLDVHFASF